MKLAVRFLAAFGSFALAQVVGSVPSLAEDPKGFICTFKAGSAVTYDKGRFKPAKASPVTLDIVELQPAQQSAVLVSGERRTPLRVIRAVSALHVLEVVGEGYINFTTIYEPDAGSKLHPAAHARHFGVLGQPIVSNYRGSCVPK